MGTQGLGSGGGVGGRMLSGSKDVARAFPDVLVSVTHYRILQMGFIPLVIDGTETR